MTHTNNTVKYYDAHVFGMKLFKLSFAVDYILFVFLVYLVYFQ